MYITFRLLLMSKATSDGPCTREDTGVVISLCLLHVFFSPHFVVGRCRLRLDTEEWKMRFEITFLPLMVIASSRVITSHIFQKAQSVASKTPPASASILCSNKYHFYHTAYSCHFSPPRPEDGFTLCLLLSCKC